MSDVDENENVQPDSIDESDGAHPVSSPYSGIDKSMSWVKGGAVLVGALGLGSLGVGGLAIMHHLNDDGPKVTATAPSSSSSSPSENPVPRSGTSSPRSSASSSSNTATPSASSSSPSASVSASPSTSSTPSASPTSATSIPSSPSTQIPVPSQPSTPSTQPGTNSGPEPSTTVIPGTGGLSHDVKDYLRPGRRSDSYHIQPGDTLSQLAEAFGRPMSELASRNDIINPDLIYSGDWLMIPHVR